MAEDTVQGYLTKHKLSSLFEDLMSKVVKELPADPIDFLIKKLQSLQRLKKSKDSPHSPSIGGVKVSRGKMQVTGTSAASKTPTKSPVSDRLSKSTSGLRPVKPRTTLSSSSTSSLPSKTTPTKATPTRPPTTAARGATASGVGTASKSASKIPRSSPIKTKANAVTTPVSAAATTTAAPRASSKHTPSRPSTAPMGMAKTTPSKASASARGGKVTSTRKTETSKKADKAPVAALPTSPVGGSRGVAKEASSRKEGFQDEDEMNEFFGAAKKSSKKHFLVVESDEDEGTEMGGASSEGEEEEEEHASSTDGSSGLDIQLIIEKRRCKHVKKSRHVDLELLVSTSATPLSLGYDEDSDAADSDDNNTRAEIMEDPDSLRDEGVELTTKSHTLIKSSPALPIESVVLCARCAAVLGKGEEGVSVPSGGLDFDSASQVFSHVSYPQWGSEDLDGFSSAEQLASARDQETASDVTLQSHDTWGGLAPPAPPQPPTSDEESEVQLPPPPPLTGQSWIPPSSPQENPHGWGQQT